MCLALDEVAPVKPTEWALDTVKEEEEEP